MIVLILAGGDGKRLFPYSTKSHPKQFLDFGHGKTLLEQTVERFIKHSFFSKIIISTNKRHIHLLNDQMKKSCLIIEEDKRKNTAFAILHSLKYMEENLDIKENEPILVVPSDHFIYPEKEFIDKILGIDKTLLIDKIISFGNPCDTPKTGYGYIQKGQEQLKGSYIAKKFVEKPNLEEATGFVNSGQFLFNLGIYAFSRKTIYQEYKKTVFDKAVDMSLKDLKIKSYTLPPISIDYVIMEKTNNLMVYPLDLLWMDLGSIDQILSLKEMLIRSNKKPSQELVDRLHLIEK